MALVNSPRCKLRLFRQTLWLFMYKKEWYFEIYIFSFFYNLINVLRQRNSKYIVQLLNTFSPIFAEKTRINNVVWLWCRLYPITKFKSIVHLNKVLKMFFSGVNALTFDNFLNLAPIKKSAFVKISRSCNRKIPEFIPYSIYCMYIVQCIHVSSG